MSRDFPGSASNYLSVGDQAAIDITGTALTFGCWINMDTSNGYCDPTRISGAAQFSTHREGRGAGW